MLNFPGFNFPYFEFFFSFSLDLTEVRICSLASSISAIGQISLLSLALKAAVNAESSY